MSNQAKFPPIGENSRRFLFNWCNQGRDKVELVFDPPLQSQKIFLKEEFGEETVRLFHLIRLPPPLLLQFFWETNVSG